MALQADLGILYTHNAESTKLLGNVSLLDWQPYGAVDISDAIGMLSFLFLGGEPHALAVPGATTTGCVPIVGCDDAPGCR